MLALACVLAAFATLLASIGVSEGKANIREHMQTPSSAPLRAAPPHNKRQIRPVEPTGCSGGTPYTSGMSLGEPVQGGLQAGVKELRHSNAFR